MSRKKSKEENSAGQMEKAEKAEMIPQQEVILEWSEDGVQLSLFGEEPYRGKRMEAGNSKPKMEYSEKMI